jgi:hypothetical protein
MASVSTFGYIEKTPVAFDIVSANELNINSADGLAVNGVILPQTFTVTFPTLAAGGGPLLAFIADSPCKVVSVKTMHRVAPTAAAVLSVQKVTAAAATTQVLTAAGIDLYNAGAGPAVAALTPVSGVLHATAANYTLAAGDSLQLTLTGAATTLAGSITTVALQRV